MPTPTFDGVALFGIAPRFRTAQNPPGGKLLSYPQVAGREWLALGGRARATIVTGFLEGASDFALETALDVFRDYLEDGGAYTLVTDTGAGTTYAVLFQFEPGDQYYDPGEGVYGVPYTARFEHLI